MTKDEALRLALEALESNRRTHHYCEDTWYSCPKHEDGCANDSEGEECNCGADKANAGIDQAITAIVAALEAKDEKANDELRRLHDLLGKANALARIRANKIDELEQRLTKTEAQLGEAVWNYGELKREQLANQQKTSGSPINTSTALEAKDEPVPVAIVEVFGKDWRLDYMALPVGKHKLYAQQYTYTTPPQRKPLTDDEKYALCKQFPFNLTFDAIAAIEAAHGIKE